MAKKKENVKRITSIGGSALIEGIMMRGPKKTYMAVRTAPDKIETEEIEFNSLGSKNKFFRLPLIRGIVGMVDSMRLSYKSLMRSADKQIDAIDSAEESMSKFERWLNDKLGDKLMGIIMGIASVLGIALALVLFFWLPTYLYDLLVTLVPSLSDFSVNLPYFGEVALTGAFRSAFEVIVKMLLFFGYIIAVSQMNDMKRVFMYHGAEHKTIFCYESDEELTVENIRKHSRFHPRCGTSFLVIMLLLGFFIGLFVPNFTDFFTNLLSNPTTGKLVGSIVRSLVKILLLPLSVGIGYELIKLCGKYDNWFTRIIAAPGLWAQRITTREPSDDMIEIAIAAVTPVIPDDGSDILNDCKCRK